MLYSALYSMLFIFCCIYVYIPNYIISISLMLSLLSTVNDGNEIKHLPVRRSILTLLNNSLQ
jgi:hypothetical protein